MARARVFEHSDEVRSIAYDPDGKTLAAGGDDNKVTVYDLQNNGAVLHTFAHSDSVRSIAYAPDGKTLAAGGYDNKVTVYSTGPPSLDSALLRKRNSLSPLQQLMLGSVFQDAISGGDTRSWLRSRMMIVGQGRVGKTCLVRSLRGEPYVQQESTQGTDISECILDRSELSSWRLLSDDEKGHEYERALAADVIAKEVRRKEAEESAARQEREHRPEKPQQRVETAPADAGKAQRKRDATPAVGRAPALDTATAHDTAPTTSGAAPSSTPRTPEQGTTNQIEEANTAMIRDQDTVKTIDDALVAQFVENGMAQRLVITAWDYGGQSVFYALHHLFLTRYGVYLVVFNLEHLSAATSDAHLDETKEFILFWLKSIALHAKDKETGTVAPIFLVGTRRDVVGHQPETLRGISEAHVQPLLAGLPQEVRDAIQRPASPDEAGPWFWAVDNTFRTTVEQPEDGAIVALREQIEAVILNDPCGYAKMKIPYNWLQLCDLLQEMQKPKQDDAAANAESEKPVAKKLSPRITLEQFQTLAVKCNITDEKQHALLLNVFHELGVLVHFNTPSALNATVVLQPQWLIDAISLVIRDYRLHGHMHEALISEFKRYDTDHDGHLNKDELASLLREAGETNVLSTDLLTLMDIDHDGKVKDEEWVSFVISQFRRTEHEREKDGLCAFVSLLDGHIKSALNELRGECAQEWADLTQKGFLHRKLLDEVVWQGYEAETRFFLTALMIKFGLLTRLWNNDLFLVPSLLRDKPGSKDEPPDQRFLRVPNASNSFRFAFEFLPTGFFERLQAYAIATSHSYRAGENVKGTLFRNEAILSFGEKTFCWLRQSGGRNIVGTVHAAADSDAFLEFQSELSVLVSDVNVDFFKNQLKFKLFLEYAAEGVDVSVPVQEAYEAVAKQLLTPDMENHGIPSGAFQHWFAEDEDEGGGARDAGQPVRQDDIGNAMQARGGNKPKLPIASGGNATLDTLRSVRKIAVIFGINDYTETTLNDLSYAVADAGLVSQTLKACGWEIWNKKPFLNAECTKNNIIYALDAIADEFSSAGEDDKSLPDNAGQFIFYFAGHGKKKKGNVGELCLSQYNRKKTSTQYKVSLIKYAMEGLPVCQSLIAIDACHSGLIFGEDGGSATLPRSYSAAQCFPLNEHPVIHAMTACTGSEVSNETGGHGIFTKFLCDQITHELHKDDEAPIVSARHVFQKLSSRVLGRSNRQQNPLYGQLFDKHFEQKCHGEFFFTLPKHDVKSAKSEKEIELEDVRNQIKEIMAQYNQAVEDEDDDLEADLEEKKVELIKRRKELQKIIKEGRPSTPSGSGLNVVRAKRGE